MASFNFQVMLCLFKEIVTKVDNIYDDDVSADIFSSVAAQTKVCTWKLTWNAPELDSEWL